MDVEGERVGRWRGEARLGERTETKDDAETGDAGRGEGEERWGLVIHAGGFVLFSRAVVHVVVVLLREGGSYPVSKRRITAKSQRTAPRARDSHPSRRRPSCRRLNLPTLRCWRTSGRTLPSGAKGVVCEFGALSFAAGIESTRRLRDGERTRADSPSTQEKERARAPLTLAS